jgi:nucleotide-binding universal stress UspA family protein
MTFKTILSVVGLEQGDSDLKVAADLCEEVGAHLSVLILAVSPPPPVDAYVPDIWSETYQSDIEKLKTRNEEVETLLAARQLSADIITEYRDLSWLSGSVAQRARYSDLTVIGPELMQKRKLKTAAIEGSLFSSGKPALLIPAGKTATLKPQRVMVGWDSRVEAVRAVRESLDMLVGAKEVLLALVEPEEGEMFGQGAEPGADVAAYLARHGARVTVERLPRSGRTTAEVLNRRATDMAADLIVMGAYGHSRARERLFGGVTKSMIDDAPAPVLMAR